MNTTPDQIQDRPARTARAQPDAAAIASFAVPGWMHRLGGWQQRHRKAAIKLGNFDTKIARDAIEDITIKAPIYVAGLARAGTTILLELLAEQPAVATHQYRDFPPLFTPWLWDRWLARVPEKPQTATERAHGDGINVTSRSPEAFEEMLWMAFFEHVHDPERACALDRETAHPEFEAFYAEHIRKILAIRGGSRYAAKGNYNLMRLAYLHKLFADARFVLAVRDPVWHIASLIKQQTLFAAGESAHPRALEHMRRVGHFEFGLDRRPIHTGDEQAIAHIRELWADGAEVEGWARYWALVYADLAERLAADKPLEAASLVIRYEDLCGDSETTLRRFYAHCGLDVEEAQITQAAARLRRPDYYQPAFSEAETKLIREITAPVAACFGY
jgi:hypothetical protein